MVRKAGNPIPEKKNQNLFGNNVLFMGSRMARKNIFGLLLVETWYWGGGGLLASREAAPTSFPEYLGTHSGSKCPKSGQNSKKKFFFKLFLRVCIYLLIFIDFEKAVKWV